MAVINRIAEFYEEMKTWRRHIHSKPEVGFECFQTADFIKEMLVEFGVDEIHEGWAKTGVVAIINGKGEGGNIALRADMDALPMDEKTEPLITTDASVTLCIKAIMISSFIP